MCATTQSTTIENFWNVGYALFAKYIKNAALFLEQTLDVVAVTQFAIS
jgi:hypothetical protein